MTTLEDSIPFYRSFRDVTVVLTDVLPNLPKILKAAGL